MPAPRWEPTEAELAVIRTHSNAAAGQRLGRDPGTVRKVRREYGFANPGKSAVEQARETEPEVGAVIPETRMPVWDVPADVPLQGGMWRALETLQAQMSALDIERDEVDVTLDDDGPALVVFQSDWHLGHTEASLARLREDLQAIRDTPGVYTILGGDLIDNVVTSVASRGMHHQQLAPIRVQKELAEEAVEYLGRANVLAMLLGNHDAWSISQDDFDPIQYLCKRLGCPYLGAYGFVNVTLGRSRTRILCAHQFRMRSSFNKTHQGKRLQDFMGDADVVFTGHTHDSAAEATHIRQHRVFIGQAGTYLRHSRYSKSLGFTPATPEMPGVLLFPDGRPWIGVYDAFREGIEILKFYRERAA